MNQKIMDKIVELQDLLINEGATATKSSKLFKSLHKYYCYLQDKKT